MNSSGEETELSISKGLSAYVRTRLQLVSIETHEALAHFQGKLAPILIALVCATSVYFLILLALVSWLGKFLATLTDNPLVGWELAAILFAILHLLTILAMKKAITSKPKNPLFEYSKAELERDREWLQKNKPKKTNS